MKINNTFAVITPRLVWLFWAGLFLAACQPDAASPPESAGQEPAGAVVGTTPATSAAALSADTSVPERQSYQDWPTGPYRVVENWPKPLPDTRHSHEGWTWGSFGGVYAESPDRIWIAMRGELPLPEGAEPWTPYAALNPSRGNANSNTDGLSATCEEVPLRGWERRWEHSIFIVDSEGNLVDERSCDSKLYQRQKE